MTTLFWIILFSIIGSVFSMIGGAILLWKQDFAKKISLFLISFAAGVLLGVAFLDLLPEALEGFGEIEPVALYALGAISFFFMLERFLWWYHHHRMEVDDHPHEHTTTSQVYLLMTGDAIHNFIDGILIAGAFLISFPLGVSISIGVIAHEVPQEIADFGVMINAGFSRTKIILFNLATALTTIVGAVGAFFALSSAEAIIPIVISITIGIFIYIALSDLIPTIHHENEHKHDVIHFLLFVGGIALIFLL